MGPTAATIVFAPCDFNCQEKSQGEAVRNLNNDRLIFLSMIYSHLSILLLSCFVDWNEFFFPFAGAMTKSIHTDNALLVPKTDDGIQAAKDVCIVDDDEALLTI